MRERVPVVVTEPWGGFVLGECPPPRFVNSHLLGAAAARELHTLVPERKAGSNVQLVGSPI